MKFLKQIRFEIKNIVKSKFLLIIGILVIAAGVAIPVIGLFTKANPNGGGGIIRPMPMEKVAYARAAAYTSYGVAGDGSQDPITVDGITIASDNPFYWNIKSVMQEKDNLQINKNQFSKPEVLDLVLALLDEEIHYYSHFAQYVTKPQDYRAELAWSSMDSLYDKFVFEHLDSPVAVLQEAVSYRKGMDADAFRKKYIDITPEERQSAYVKADETLNSIFSIVETNDFAKYIDLKIRQANSQIADLQANIAIQQQAIVDNPSQEDSINSIIVAYNLQIQIIQTNNIPILQYRLAKHIVPGEDIWQNTAISDIENSRTQLPYMTIAAEDKFNQDTGLIQQYGTYRKYVAAMQSQIDRLNNTVIIAQRSLDANAPDMKYVASGSRSRTVQFLDYSVFVALFGVLLGGWIIASEYQQGTIRLLMIRPKTRTKILMSKFIAAFVISLGIYLAGSLLNILANGICYGFADFAYPNYSIGGQSGFFAYYAPKFLMCIIPILFTFTFAFMLSVVVKNIAVSIAVPIVCFIGCIITMTFFAYRSAMEWIAYTPIPFMQLSSFFIPYSTVQQAMQNGLSLSMPYGISLLLVLSAVCTFVSILVFKRRDIAN